MTGLCFRQIWYSSVHPTLRTITSSDKIIPKKNLENSLNYHELSRGLSRAILLKCVRAVGPRKRPTQLR